MFNINSSKNRLKQCNFIRCLQLVLCFVCLLLSIFILVSFRSLPIVLTSILFVVASAFFLICLVDVLATCILQPILWPPWILFSITAALFFFLCCGFLLSQVHRLHWVLFGIAAFINAITGIIFLIDTAILVCFKESDEMPKEHISVSPRSQSLKISIGSECGDNCVESTRASEACYQTKTFVETGVQSKDNCLCSPNKSEIEVVPKKGIKCKPLWDETPFVPSYGGTFHVSKNAAPLYKSSEPTKRTVAVSTKMVPRTSPCANAETMTIPSASKVPTIATPRVRCMCSSERKSYYQYEHAAAQRHWYNCHQEYPTKEYHTQDYGREEMTPSRETSIYHRKCIPQAQNISPKSSQQTHSKILTAKCAYNQSPKSSRRPVSAGHIPSTRAPSIPKQLSDRSEYKHHCGCSTTYENIDVKPDMMIERYSTLDPEEVRLPGEADRSPPLRNCRKCHELTQTDECPAKRPKYETGEKTVYYPEAVTKQKATTIDMTNSKEETLSHFVPVYFRKRTSKSETEQQRQSSESLDKSKNCAVQ